MDQKRIKELLTEASRPECSVQRQNQIQCEMGQATSALKPDGVYSIHGPEAGIHLILDALYSGTAEHKRELLPSLFPVFALLCGDREKGVLISDIDWSSINQTASA